MTQFIRKCFFLPSSFSQLQFRWNIHIPPGPPIQTTEAHWPLWSFLGPVTRRYNGDVNLLPQEVEKVRQSDAFTWWTRPAPARVCFSSVPSVRKKLWERDVSRGEGQVQGLLSAEVNGKGGWGSQVAFPQGQVTLITPEEFCGLGGGKIEWQIHCLVKVKL